MRKSKKLSPGPGWGVVVLLILKNNPNAQPDSTVKQKQHWFRPALCMSFDELKNRCTGQVMNYLRATSSVKMEKTVLHLHTVSISAYP